MDEAVSKAASNLVPLLLVIGVVFGSLIILALVLRTRLRRELGGSSVRRRVSVLDVAAQDMLSVLGRSFVVDDVQPLDHPDLAGIWCVLQTDDAQARTAIARKMDLVVHFPGQADAPEEAFPDQISRSEGPYQRQAQVQQLAQGWRLACYRGPGERWLALEEKSGQSILWRGKEVPTEGVTVLEESEDA